MDRRVQHHRERLAEAMRLELKTIVESELGDPRIAPLAVTEVLIAPDGRSVRVMVALLGSNDPRTTLERLRVATGYIRLELAERLGLQRAPELVFQLDRSEQDGARIEELLRRLDKRAK